MKKYDIIIIGGGPAGMMAAYAAQTQNKRVLLLEKNEKLGKKLYITGKGRCNITSSLDISDFFENIPRNSNFMYSSLYGFTNYDLIEYFNSHNLPTKEERGSRIFPVSDKSSDVISTMTKSLNNVVVELNSRVSKIEKIKNEFHVNTGTEKYISDKLIIATGGLSYPTTGSTGDGYKFAKGFGHEIIDTKPSLSPILTKDEGLDLVTGITVKNATIKVYIDGEKKKEEFGDFLFTHRGISGPVIITLSDFITDYDSKRVKIYCNFKPAIPDVELEKRLLKEIDENPKKDLISLLSLYFPKNIATFLLRNSQLNEQMKVHEITKTIRTEIKELITNYEFKFESVDDIKYAIITKGGVSTDELNPSTLESKLIEGLYFCGEIIDVNGYTGGFNLQIAFSTGHLAGLSASI